MTGSAVPGQTLTGSYTYSDNENDTQGTSTFKWYRGNSSNKQVIAGATSKTYTITSNDLYKQIFFEVTPVASVGTTTGTPVVSGGTAPVRLPGQF